MSRPEPTDDSATSTSLTSPIDSFSGPHYFLSNFSEEGGVFPTLEHPYQAFKAISVADAIYVMSAPTPGKAKKRGRAIQVRSDWEDSKIEIMYDLLLQKFSDPDIQAKLLATGDAELIEGNTWGDTFWGVCDGVGENVLGQLLMIVRDHYR